MAIASAPRAVYTTQERVRRCSDCGSPLDTSVAANVRYCARDRQRRRALTFLRQAIKVLHAMPQQPGVVAARDKAAGAVEELGG